MNNILYSRIFSGACDELYDYLEYMYCSRILKIQNHSFFSMKTYI